METPISTEDGLVGGRTGEAVDRMVREPDEFGSKEAGLTALEVTENSGLEIQDGNLKIGALVASELVEVGLGTDAGREKRISSEGLVSNAEEDSAGGASETRKRGREDEHEFSAAGEENNSKGAKVDETLAVEDGTVEDIMVDHRHCLTESDALPAEADFDSQRAEAERDVNANDNTGGTEDRKGGSHAEVAAGQEGGSEENVANGSGQGSNAAGPRYKKRKIALFLGYSGAGYQGMQKNPGAVTIEGELEDALFRAGAISEANYGHPRKVDWRRAARTDKGVSAVGQVVSGSFVIDPPGLVERLNSHLPTQIRVYGYKRVTASFNAKFLCDRRRYEYVLPVYAFDPTVHLDRASIRGAAAAAAQEQFAGLETQIDCSATQAEAIMGREVAPKIEQAHGLMESQEYDGRSVRLAREEQEAALSEPFSQTPEVNAEMKDISSEDILAEEMAVPMDPEEARRALEEKVKRSSFKFGEAEADRLNRIFGAYKGHHNFHNFTARTKASDPSACRNIIEFETAKVFSMNGLEFVRCVVVGQSFMLHQIRKMVGLAVAIMRGLAPESILSTALSVTKVNVPMAPELGLFLEECYYSDYNRKFKATHDEISLRSFVAEVDEFKREFIYPHIANTEAKNATFALWLHSLNERHYPEFAIAKEEGKTRKLLASCH